MSGGGTSSRFAFLRGWHCILLAWLLAYAARPFMLGFYDDDWYALLIPTQHSAPFSWERFAFMIELFANRPLTGLITFVVSSVCGASPVLWHVAISMLALVTALALRRFLRSLLRLIGQDDAWAADLGAALWLVFPWTLGTMARPACSPNVAAVTFLALSGMVLFDSWRKEQAAWLRPSLLFLASCLAYEALYGQFVVLFAIGWLCGIHRRVGVKRFLLSALPFAAVQVLVVGWNRLVPLFISLAPSKSFCPIWWKVGIDNLHRLRYFIGHSARELSPAVELLLLAVFVLCVCVLLWNLSRKSERTTSLRRLGLLGVCGLGVLIGLLVLSVAGYSIRGAGLGSRTTMAFSVWLATALAVGLGSLPSRPVAVRTVGIGCVTLLGGLLVFATQTRLREWSEAWAIEQEVLANAPLEDLAQAHPDAVVLYMGPERHKGVRVFGYRRNLYWAMKYVYPQFDNIRFYCAKRNTWKTVWDGKHFEQRERNPKPWDRWKVWNQCETPEVWVWIRGSGRAYRAKAPLTYTIEMPYPQPREPEERYSRS